MKILICLISLLVFTDCNSKMEKSNRPVPVKVDTSGMEYSSKYICPMHCKGSGSHEMGVCPVCGMDYELNENYPKDPGTDSLH